MISLDTSTTRSGFGIYANGKLDGSGVIDKSNIKNSAIRIDQMMFNVFDLLNEHKPGIVAIEETKAPRNAQTQRMLTMLLGAVRGWCICNDSEFVALPPSVWRKAVYGHDIKNRELAKKTAVEEVLRLYNMEVSDDEAEGILVGQALINIRCK